MSSRTAVACAAVIAAAALFAGCGGGGDEDGDPTRFGQALAGLPGKDPAGAGYGWVDVRRLRESGEVPTGLAWAGEALGPGADELALASPALTRAGYDPAGADQLVAVTSNYPFSVRVDGVDPAPVEATLRDSGAREGEDRGWSTFDIGPERSIPLGTPAEAFGALGARVAAQPERLIFAKSDLDRSNMIGRDGVALDDDQVAAAASCLGDVMAARLLLNNHTYLPGAGPDLLAAGVLAPPDGPGREVFCAVDDEAGTVDEAAAALEETFGPGGEDAIAERPTAELFSESSVERLEVDGLPTVRVEVTDAEGVDPGEMFGAIDRGSVMTYMGFGRPPKPDDLK